MRLHPMILLLFAAALARAAAPIDLALRSHLPLCSAPNEAEITALVSGDLTPPVAARMVALWRWFDAASRFTASPVVRFTAHTAGEADKELKVERLLVLGGGAADWTPDPRHPERQFTPPGTLRVCMTLERALPDGSLDAKLEFLNPAGLTASAGPLPDDLNAPLVNHSFAGSPLPSAVGTTTPAARTFARELDFNAVLLSSVSEKTSAGQTVRTRDTKATADLFLAPVLRLRKLSGHVGGSWFTYLTPISAEAHASTQPIAKDTLSLNRIAMGPEYEFRWYFKNRQGALGDNALRMIAMFKDASDRDFKLNEPKFMAEFRPIWGDANRDVLDPKLIRNVPGFRLTRGDKIGRKLSPFFGMEKGASYERGLPASALKALGPFTRGYMGLDAGIDFNRMVAFSTTQELYIRGELDNDWVHYMRNSLQWTFLASHPQFASSLVLSFEKGSLPPFRSSVNALTLGIRVQSSQWGLLR